jgi:2-isopropylmalate synthase
MGGSIEGGNAKACAFLEITRIGSGGYECYGAGIDTNILTASIRALVSGVNRLEARYLVESKAFAA